MKKSVLSKLIIGLTAISLFATIPAVASNYHDTAFSFYFPTTSGTSVT